MNQTKSRLVIFGVTLSFVAVALLTLAPVLNNNDEMAYASPGGAGGAHGTPGHASTHVTCTSTGCTVSSSTATGSSGGGGGNGGGPRAGHGGRGGAGGHADFGGSLSTGGGTTGSA